MSFLNILKLKSAEKELLAADDLKKSLDNILLFIDSIKGDFDLKSIYDAIGEELVKKKISTLFTVYDNHRNLIALKNYYLHPDILKISKKFGKENIIEKKISLSDLVNYQKAFKEKKAQFGRSGLKEIIEIKAANGKNKKNLKLNSIVAPLVLKNEIIGALELCSPDLDKIHAPAVDNFAKDFSAFVANSILYNEIKFSEARYRDLFENAEEGFAIYKSDMNKFIEINRKLKDITGYTNDEFSQMKYLNIFFESERGRVKKYIDDRVTNKSEKNLFNESLETKIIAKNKAIIYVNLVVNPTVKKSEWFFIINDITKNKTSEIALAESRQKYKKLWDFAPVGYHVLDIKGNIIQVNKTEAEILGYAKKDMEGKSIFKFIAPEERKEAASMLKSIISNTPILKKYNRTFLKKDGSRIYASVGSKLEKDQQGKSVSIRVTIEDITEKIKLHKKIEWAKNHYEQVIDTIQDAICTVDRDMKIISVNKAFAEKVNRPINSLKGMKYKDGIKNFEKRLLKSNFCRDCQKCLIMQVFVDGKVEEEELIHQGKNGDQYFYKIIIFPGKNKDGFINQAVISIRDVTITRKVDEQIRRLSEFNKRILENAPVSIIVLDKKGAIVSVNKLAQELMNKTSEQAIGRKIIATQSISKNQSLVRAYKSLFEKGLPFYYEKIPYTPETSNNKMMYLDIIGVPLLTKEKKVEGAISMAIDNTESILAHEKLEILNNELEKKIIERTVQLDKTNKDLNKVLELKSRFISDSSHELRTPLTIMQGNLDLLMRQFQNSDAETIEVFNIIRQEIRNMTKIISDLTLLTNGDASAEDIQYEKINLTRLIKTVCDSLKIMAEEKRIKIQTGILPASLEMMGDESKIEKMFLNLIRNSLKYGKNKGKVKIRVLQKFDKIEISIQDNGIGISKEDLLYIFERFYRTSDARILGENGSGLGLSICKWIVEAHGGYIHVESEMGRGSIFTVHLHKDYKKQNFGNSLF